MTQKITCLSLHFKLQSLSEEIRYCFVSPKAYEYFSKQLSAIEKEVQNLYPIDLSFANHSKEILVSLYRQLEDRLVEQEINLIRHRSEELKEQVTRKAIRILKQQIHDFEYHHRPAIADRQVVAEAKVILKQAEKTLKKNKNPSQLNWFPKQQTSLYLGFYIEYTEELFEIAALLYNDQISQAKHRFHLLPEEYKKHVRGNMEFLNTNIFENALETIQCLIGTARELVGTHEGFPSKEEVDEIFLELFEILDQEKAIGDPCMFKSKAFVG
ncbi:MAG: hypothetical protein LBC45_05675 [Chlamydiales bacterium]|jgi:hypothetical protein|nr:hypothetical protein [Chlamydiales bacterium]